MTAIRGFAYRNMIDDATLGGGDWDDLENLQSGHLWTPATSVNATEAKTRIDIDFGSAVLPRVVWIPAHNLSSAATVRITRGTTSGGSDVSDSGALTAWPWTPPLGVYDGRVFGVPVFIPATAGSARYMRLQISDTANTAGFVWISRPFISADLFLPDVNPVGIERDWQTFSGVKLTSTGVDWTTARDPLHRAGLVYHVMTETEALLFSEIQRTHDITSEVLYLESTHDRAMQQARGFTARMRELGRTEYPFWRYPGFAVGFDKRGGAPA